MKSTTRLTGLALALVTVSATAWAETTVCTAITALPYFISTPGTYCLKASLATSGDGISIGASDVVVDLNGHVLDGTPAGPGVLTDAIFAFNQRHVVVRNGTVRGFFQGIRLDGSSPASAEGYLVERMRVEHCTWTGIGVRGKGSIVRDSLVLGTTGAIVPGFGGVAIGLRVDGDLGQITDNQVIDTVEQPGGVAFGIILSSSTGGTVARNVVSNTAFGPTRSTGISLFQGRHTAVGNHVVNMRFGLQFGDATSIYKDNTVGGATTAFIGGTAAGATNFAF